MGALSPWHWAILIVVLVLLGKAAARLGGNAAFEREAEG